MVSQNRVKEVREALKLSGLEVARRAKIAPSTLHNIENGRLYAYPGWRKRLSRALGVPESELFPGGEKR